MTLKDARPCNPVFLNALVKYPRQFIRDKRSMPLRDCSFGVLELCGLEVVNESSSPVDKPVKTGRVTQLYGGLHCGRKRLRLRTDSE